MTRIHPMEIINPSLRTAILETVAFFDIFDYPLTSFEIWQYLPHSATLLEVRNILENSVLPLQTDNGFFFLPGREKIIITRRERYNDTDQKIKKAHRRLYLFRWLPGIKLICLANSLGTHNLRPGGDTDLFIITKQGRLWFVKLCATIIVALFGLRPSATKSADQICLSFLVDESALDLSPFRLPTDTYFRYWLAGLMPLYGEKKSYTALIAANGWLQQELPNWVYSDAFLDRRFKYNPRSSRLIFGSSLEKAARFIQARLMSPTIKKLANHDQRVVVNDHVLKLHTIDRREQFKNEFNLRMQRLA